MTKRFKRIAAFALALAMSVSLVLSSVPALAASDTAEVATPDKPKLVMDFLGDNKAAGSYYDKTDATGGGLGDGTLHAPQDSDQAWKIEEDDGEKWNGYVQADAAATDTVAGTETIFWMGIGIQDVDKFVLSKDGNGLYSAEIALYYNPYFVEPYDNAAGDGELFKSSIEEHMLGSAGKRNQWPSDRYKVVKALTKQEVLNDSNDPSAKGDFTAEKYGFTEGYGTEEFTASELWKMAYISVEMTEEQLASTAWLSGSHKSEDTYYIAMVPFVLRHYDPREELCIRLARNASTFSIGAKKNNGMGSYGDGGVTYGNWDKYTFHDPQHDLKLMLDYTGDLNIFTNTRDIKYQKASLVIIDGGNADNKAQMIINNEPLASPSQIADASGEEIIHLTGGEELRVSAKKVSGFTVTVEVRKSDGTEVEPVDITAVDPWTDEWTFLMPSGTDVDVTVRFEGHITPDTKFKVELEVIDNSHSEPNNTAKLTAPGGLTTAVLTTGTDVLSGGGAPAGTRITVSVTRNSDYNVKVTLIPATGDAPTLSKIIDSSEAQTYTFPMSPCDIKVQVEFELKTPHKATLTVQGTVAADKRSQNWAKMGYTDGESTLHTTEDVSFADLKNSPGSVPGLNKNQIQSASGRTIYIDTVCSPEYQVSDIIFRKNDDALDSSVKATATTIPGRYAFTMPDYEIKVIVVYELIKTYRVRLVFDEKNMPEAGEGATLNGTDVRGTLTLSLNKDQYDAFMTAGTLDANNLLEVFPNANMGVSFFHENDSGEKVTGLGSGRTAKVTVYYPEYPVTDKTDVIMTSGSAGSGYSFTMQKLDHPSNDAAHTDAVYVVVSFMKFEGKDLIARIYEDRSSGVGASEARTTWAGIAPGHNNPINVHEDDEITVSIKVEPGAYIASIQVYDEGPEPSYAGAPLGIPVTLSGIGYNNALGGTETASFIMPNQNATIVVKYGKGAPPEEPKFTATIRKNGDGDGVIDIANATTGSTPYTAPNAKWVDAEAGHQITATYKPDGDSYVSGVTVTADVPGTTVSWTTTVTADGGTVIDVDTMPAANVVIAVTYDKREGKVPSALTLVKEEDPAHPANTVTVTPSGGKIQVGTVTTATTTAYENEVVTAVIDVDAGWHVVSAMATLSGSSSAIPVTLSGNGYNGGLGGTETAVFQMPADAATLTVTFASGEPENTIKLVVVDDAKNAGNTATLYLDGVPQTPTANFETQVGPMPAAAGTPVKVKITEESGYAVDLPILTTPSGVVTVTWTAVDTFEFVMPGEPLVVTVPFLTDGKADKDFYANLIFRDGDGNSAAGVAAAKGTFLDTPFTKDNYADQLDGTLRYSRKARPGADVPFAVRIPDGYYISDITVTPADFGVEPTITGMIATQQGRFLMPAGNVRVNVYLSKGWPDEARYQVKLHVEGPDDRSTATLKNVTASPVTALDPLPRPGKSSGSGVLTALDGDKMRVTLDRDDSHDLESITILDGNEAPVSYRWTTDGEAPAVEFSVPGSSVDVYVKYTKERDTNDYQVRLHADLGSTSAAVAMTKNSSPATAPFDARGGDNIGMTVSGPANALITYAYAVASDGTMVSLGDPSLAGTFANAATEPHGFIMPFHADVDVYIGFTTATPGDNQYSLTLQVNGPADSGAVEVKEYDNNKIEQGRMSAVAVGGAAMLAHSGNKITAEVRPAGGYALYSLIAYISTGERVVVSLDPEDSHWMTYKFTMPENTTHIEAEFRKVEENAFQIQVVVNNTVNGGAGHNDAFLYTPPGSTSDGFKFRSGVSAGTTFDLGFIVDTGYQVDTILAVPQGSGVVANIPLPATTSGRTQVKMPASNLVIYVTFRVDNTTRYNVVGTISYPDGLTPPKADDGSNTLELKGSWGQTSTLTSNDATAPGSIAMIQEVKGGRVEAKWKAAPGYAVSSYTVKTSSGQVVLSEPNATHDGCFFYMPAAPVEVNVIFTKPDDRAEYTATLHYLKGNPTWGDKASIEKSGSAAGSGTDEDGGMISGLHVGDKIDISATPGTDRYIQTIYVLQNGPDIAQMGQNLPLQHSDLATVPATGDFFMPSGNVDVYVVFADSEPRRDDDFMAAVKVNAPGGPNRTNFATILTDASNRATANCNEGPASILVTKDSLVTVQVTVDSNHVIDSVTGTPITPAMQPHLSTGTAAGATTVYTFTMPANNASIIVNLKQKQSTKYKLYLHVSNQGEAADEDDNETELGYGEPVVDTLVRPGAAPTSRDPVVPSLETPGGSPVTLTVRPEEGYYVKAAYVVYEDGLVSMTPAKLPTGYANRRSDVGLEGATAVDIGVAGAEGKNINTASFTMPNGNADVYVVYEKGEVPKTPWYNVVVIATDSGGTHGNEGHGTVKVSSKDAITGDPGKIAPPAEVLSEGKATYFYSVPSKEVIRLDASTARDGYQYDTSTGMVLTYQTPDVTASPDIEAVDLGEHPRGDVQEFGMPESNVGVHINFTKAGATKLWAKLHVIQADGIPGYNANTVTLSTGAGASYRYVDNHELTAAGPTGSAPKNPDTTDNMVLKDLTSLQLISTLIHPRDGGTRVVQVTVTQVDEDDNIIGSTFATHAGDPTDSSLDRYNYIMGENNVHIYVVLAKKTDTDRFVAVATPVYDAGVTAAAGGTGTGRNEITGLVNTTSAGLSSAPYWTEIKAKDRVKVTYTAQAGVYVDVKAFRAGTSIELPDPVEFGIGDGAPGFAYVDVPDPGCDVEIQVNFSTKKPSDKILQFVSHNHDGKPTNVTELQKEDSSATDGYTALSGKLIPTAGTLTDITWPATGTHSETPGTKLKVLINSLEPGYTVQKVEVKVGSFTADFFMKGDFTKPDTLTLVDADDAPVDLPMPNGDTVITVHFKPKDDGLIPFDPKNVTSTKYKKNWIKAENRGDYLVVTVPHLNNAEDSNRTSVSWSDTKKDRFKFYLDETPAGATTPVYTSIDYILKRSRPTDAPAATGTEPYWKDNFLGTHYGTTTSYIGARFVVEIMTDKEIDDTDSIINKDTAKSLAATLRKIMDNDGTKSSGDKHSLYISCEETTYKADGSVDKTTEGGKVDFEVPRYYALVGVLESYAPTHIATFTLSDETKDSKVVFTSKLEGRNGIDFWQQDFKVKLTSDFEGKLKDKSFTLTIEKAGHVTYTRTTISLDTSASASAGTYDATNLTFKFGDTIRLFCGDLDDNGYVEQRDVQLLIAVTMGYFPVSQATDSSDKDWDSSVYNPATAAYAADLNGDGEVDVRDMNIALNEENYGRSADDYGGPTGLTAATPKILSLIRLPKWYIDMITAGMPVPEWADAMVQERREIPEWVGELLLDDVDIPEWIQALVMEEMVIPEWLELPIRANTDIPQWTRDLVETNVDIPAWAVAQALMGEIIPNWAVELIKNGEELPTEMIEMLENGEALPETKPEPKPAVLENPLEKQLETLMGNMAAKPLEEGKAPTEAGLPSENKELSEQAKTDVTTDKTLEKQPDASVVPGTEIKDMPEAKTPGAAEEELPGNSAGPAPKPNTDDASILVDNEATGNKLNDTAVTEERPVDNADGQIADTGMTENGKNIENAPAGGDAAKADDSEKFEEPGKSLEPERLETPGEKNEPSEAGAPQEEGAQSGPGEKNAVDQGEPERDAAGVGQMDEAPDLTAIDKLQENGSFSGGEGLAEQGCVEPADHVSQEPAEVQEDGFAVSETDILEKIM